MGYSLAPPPDFGRPFGDHSDLDLTIVSRELFEQVAEAFGRFRSDFVQGTLVATSDHEEALWRANITFGQRNIPRGFMDASKVPNRPAYLASQNINKAMWALSKKLEATAGAPTFRRASTRIYQDWQSFIEQATRNLTTATT